MLITITGRVETLINGYKFSTQVEAIIDKRDEWLYFKVQPMGHPLFISSLLTKRIQEAHKMRLLEDNNIISTEFIFYQ